MPNSLRASTLALLCLMLFGCAAAPAKRDPRDPWERMNRSIYQFNDKFDKAIARPVARTYQRITPRPVRQGVSNFIDNLTYPTTIVNDFLQAKFLQTCADTGRLVLNTTLGIGGILDPASAAGLEKHNEDFGQTLGRWGVRPGPYLVIPFAGFSDVRDAFGRLADIYTIPTHYITNGYISWPLWGLEVLDTRYRLLGTDALVDSAFDPYGFTRNAYLARRRYLVTDGNVEEEPPPEDPGADVDTRSAPPPSPKQ